MTKAENKAAENAEGIVRSWAQRPMHWSTHRAANKYHGEYKSSKGGEYKWNDDL